tara:strand:- start:423 stop:542 length:120 start_codon:yes stop_codon:yes gene_type:complete
MSIQNVDNKTAKYPMIHGLVNINNPDEIKNNHANPICAL